MPDNDIKPSDITPEAIYRKRRKYIKMGLWASLASSLPFTAGALNRDSDGLTLAQRNAPDWLKNQLTQTASADPKQPGHSTDETLTPYQDATSYNNFYEFGMGKKDPYYYASQFDPHPWTVEITGLVNKPGSYHLEDLVKPHKLQERIYRLRCVEAWSMVIPWIGFPLADLIKQVEPMAGARYVAFRTLEDRTRLRGQRSFFSTINWPYREGLRLDEATHPLTLMAVGMYGKVLPGQNGAPLRLVVPWKYGFKSIKSIVSIEFTATRPETTWNQLQAREYGFYANVNPQVSHPRWSQRTERRLPSAGLFPRRIQTQLFNGYADQVASLYTGMDLRQNY